MAYGVTTTGFEAKPLDVIETEMKEAIRAAVSPTLNLGSKSLLGQFVGVTASQLRQLWEAAQANYAARDRAQAYGAALDSIGELTGTPRDPATRSMALMTATLDAGVYPANALKVYVTGDSTKVFENEVEITSAGGVMTDLEFRCTQTGPVVAPAGTLVNIATPYTGFSAPTNPLDAVEGVVVEADPAYRQRQEDELQKGSASVDAIRSALLDNDDVTYATVLENDTDATDVNGLPPHSIAAVVEGATDAVVAGIIFTKKAAGIKAHGSTTVSVTDQQGNAHAVGLTRPTLIPMTVDVVATYDTDFFNSDSAAEQAIKDAILAEGDPSGEGGGQRVGLDVITAKYIKALMQVEGMIDVAIQWSSVPSSPVPSAANFVVGPFERAEFIEGQIFPVVTGAPGAP